MSDEKKVYISATFCIDRNKLIVVSGRTNLGEAIKAELGWVEQSGIILKDWKPIEG